ncbi:unnamed protein product [Protopolystoma xenopodis]|uniref:Protein kinase domain-containing protein n=1 Tax=Protopolystoma xenopodis TaxID=117903 RepID=A0A448WUC1_9PLAT|nr:unnamed protein product [Protopolystoma xenopodis]
MTTGKRSDSDGSGLATSAAISGKLDHHYPKHPKGLTVAPHQFHSKLLDDQPSAARMERYAEHLDGGERGEEEDEEEDEDDDDDEGEGMDEIAEYGDICGEEGQEEEEEDLGDPEDDEYEGEEPEGEDDEEEDKEFPLFQALEGHGLAALANHPEDADSGLGRSGTSQRTSGAQFGLSGNQDLSVPPRLLQIEPDHEVHATTVDRLTAAETAIAATNIGISSRSGHGQRLKHLKQKAQAKVQRQQQQQHQLQLKATQFFSLDCRDSASDGVTLAQDKVPPPASAFGRVESYKKLDVLGEGSYATVYRGYSQ